MNLILRIFHALALLASARVLAADDPGSLAFFEQKIRPALAEHCYECHSAKAKKLKGGLALDAKEGWQKGGDSGTPTIVPGKPDEGLFLRYVRHLEPDMEMPPKKPKLPDALIADFAVWIKAGAVDPRDQATVEVKRADKSWWSLQPLAKDFKHVDIDGFIDARLAEQKLTRSAPAKPQALIRRLSYDLTGLPPTQTEVDTFVTAHQVDARKATEALVDRLLASPRYGEHWGRHWLDVVRFGESNGFERNFIIDDIYPFRDYVIRSLNDDKPFDQLMREHLAGDVLGKFDPAVEVGSAFLVAGPYDDVGNQDANAQKVIRAATLDDVLIIWCTEFGRMPTHQVGTTGRDHNPDAYTTWMMGAGVKGGVSYGATDDFGRRSVTDVATCYDFYATVLHLLGLDHEKLTYYHNGANRRLTDVHGHVIKPILA